MRGYFGIGVYHPKTEENIGTLWRSAYLFGASFIFTIGKRYKKQSSDTSNTYAHVPLLNYMTYEDFYQHMPFSCPLVCVELTDKALPLDTFIHLERGVYLLGAEDHGLPESITDSKTTVIIPSGKKFSLNVATAGSIVMYDRFIKSHNQ